MEENVKAMRAICRGHPIYFFYNAFKSHTSSAFILTQILNQVQQLLLFYFLSPDFTCIVMSTKRSYEFILWPI